MTTPAAAPPTASVPRALPVDPRSRARNAQYLLVLAVPLAAWRGAVGVWDHPPLSHGVRIDALTLLSSLALLGAETAAVVTLLLWLRRCRSNADLLAPGVSRYSPGWVVGAWFTPPLLWWRPRRIVLDVHRASGSDSGASSTITLINVWWTIRVVLSVTSLAIEVLTGSITVTNPWVMLVTQGGGAISAAALFLVIRRVTDAQVRAVEQGHSARQAENTALV
jgi:hypothetical protein